MCVFRILHCYKLERKREKKSKMLFIGTKNCPDVFETNVVIIRNYEKLCLLIYSVYRLWFLSSKSAKAGIHELLGKLYYLLKHLIALRDVFLIMYLKTLPIWLQK